MEKMPSPPTERKQIFSNFWTENIEREPNNFITEIATRMMRNVFKMPEGAFSGLATYIDESRKEKRISPKLDELMAEMFTNYRRVIKEYNKIGPISTINPQEKYEGEIDAVIEKTQQDFEKYKEEVDAIKEKLRNREISSKRVLVENVIGSIKRFRILSERYKNRRKRFGLRFSLIAGIHNFEL
jgi:hypothetical protein